MNEVLIGNAVKFLSDSSVRTSTAEKQLGFLRSKGLTDDEIEESYRRTALPNPLNTNAAPPPPSSSNYYNQSYNSGSNYAYGNGDQEHLYQLARTSTTARWLLLLAVFASAIAFLSRHIPQGLYQRFQKWLSRSGALNDKTEARILELNKKIDTIRSIVEGISKRQSQMENQIISLRYPHHSPSYQTEEENRHYATTTEFGDCLDAE